MLKLSFKNLVKIMHERIEIVPSVQPVPPTAQARDKVSRVFIAVIIKTLYLHTILWD